MENNESVILLLKEKTIKLKEKIIGLKERIFELEMELWRNEHKFAYESIIEKMVEDTNLLNYNNWCIGSLREIVIEFGYEKVENYFIKKSKELGERQDNE